MNKNEHRGASLLKRVADPDSLLIESGSNECENQNPDSLRFKIKDILVLKILVLYGQEVLLVLVLSYLME